ncbi:MAG: hypothetical protein ACE5H3_11640 [Planctomycetota bacterium]
MKPFPWASWIAALAFLAGSSSLALRLLLPPQPPGGPPASPPSQGEPPEKPVDPALFRRRMEAAARGPHFPAGTQGAVPDSRRASSTPAAGGFPPLFAPLRFRAAIQEGGIRLSWLPNPDNPVAGLSYRLTRWSADRNPALVGETRSLEFLDPVDCEGVLYHYRLSSVLTREILPGNPARRESPPATATAEKARTAVWRALGTTEDDQIVLQLERPGRPPVGPLAARAGEEVGGSGWILDAWRVRETSRKVPTRSPRFDALGRRVIIDGHPADRVRETAETRLLANIRLIDPCGASWSLELLLPRDSQGSRR